MLRVIRIGSYSKKTIHHELYHLIEAKFNGSSYYKDPVWTAFNDSEFKYKEAAPFDPEESDEKKLFHPNKGFITSGAKSAPWQDKAEVYAGLFVEEISACLHEWIREDEILRNKVNYMKDFLLQYSDEMTSDFWANLCTGECSPLDVTVTSSYEIQDSRFSAVLSNDANVSLIAITEGSGNSAKCWKPNGEIFDEAPFTIDDPKTTVDDEFKQYQFFFYIKTNQSPLPPPSLERLGEKLYEARTPYVDGNGRIFLNVCFVTCGLEDDKETSQLSIGVPLGKWTVEAAYNPKTKVTSGSDHSIKFGRPRKKKGKLKIEVSHNISDFRKTAKQIVAVDHTGEIHHSAYSQFKFAKGGIRWSLHFSDLRLAQVKEFQFKTRPYTWVTFENISLRPGQITDVQVKVGDN